MPSKDLSAKLYRFSDDDNMDVREDSIPRSGKPKKTSGACVDCKSVKVRCEFVPGERYCRRCQSKNLPCQRHQRKKRKPADTHEQLQERSHEQDLYIQNLLLEFDQRRDEQKVRQWMTKSASADLQQQIKWAHKGKSPESTVISHFGSGAATQSLQPPEIVKHCNLYPEDIRELFLIYFEHINPYFSLLDQNYHTPEKVIWNSPFLFTVVCAVASRYFSRRDLYPLSMEFARDFAGKALVEGYRSIDVCQAYLIMALYPLPTKKWIEDKSWLLMGVAIRMAIELELNQPSPASLDERESLNRGRTWLCCFCVDGWHAIQFGKLPMIRLDDYLARTSREWYKSSSMNTPFDVHLCAYVQMLLLMANWRESIKSDSLKQNNQREDIVKAAIQTQNALNQEMDIWADAYTEEYKFMPIPICNYRGNTTHMAAAYLGLVVLLAGFQEFTAEDLNKDSDIFVLSVDAARSVIQIMLERLYPTGYLRYALDSSFLFVTFGAAFLINLFRPRYLHLLDKNLQDEIIILVSRLISVLSSSDVALDGRHTPALYSRFLSSLKTSRAHFLTEGSVDSRQEREATPSDGFNWPDVRRDAARLSEYEQEFSPQNQGDIDMDFSLSHFIKSVSQETNTNNSGQEGAGLGYNDVEPISWFFNL